MSGMEELRQSCQGCMKCELGATRTNLVFGVGNEKAKLMFVGEGPGEQEDLQGVPFVGRAGKLLDDMLAMFDLSREDVYIANIVKCRPPKNRDPKPEETELCLPFLREQTRILRPRVLVCLGRIAAQVIISPEFRVTREHGVFYDRGGILMMGTFHPAALLRDPQKKKESWQDLQQVRSKLDELKED